MTFARASSAPRSLGRIAFRRTATQPRPQAWRQIARRNYASDSGHGQKGSDLPWMIGSVAFTVPAAVWLWNQGPETGGHHGDHGHEEKESHDKTEEESSEDSEEKADDEEESDAKEEKADEDKSDSDNSKDESSDEDSDKESDKGKEGDDSSPNAPGQINYKPESGKGPGEGQKGPRKPTEKKGEKDSASDHSGAKNPHLDDDEKSTKAEGVKETAKIHGTVDSSRPASKDNE